MKVFVDFQLSELRSPPSGEPSADEFSWTPKVRAAAVIEAGPNGATVNFCREGEEGDAGELIVYVDLGTGSSFHQAGPALQLWLVQPPPPGVEPAQHVYARTFSLRFPSEAASSAFAAAVQRHRQGSSAGAGPPPAEGASIFARKIEAASAQMYFHYYGQLLHQQNMLQDYIRTGTYYAAVLENRADFEGKVVLDVGAGSGILSLFAAQAGAQHVYAIEASPMAEYARKLAAGNGVHGSRITVVHGKVEEVGLPEKADVLISEPMGTLLVNERMLESYIIARERFLKPGGKMFPSLGRIHMAPFSDEYLYVEIANKALFWQQPAYYGVDLTPLYGEAFKGYFSQPVVDAFDPRLLVAPGVTHTIDFAASKEEDLYEIDIPLSFRAATAARVHGLACWFDVLFDGSTAPRWLSTAPGAPTTHWYQLRCVLSQPLYVLAGQPITGRLHLVAHASQSYAIHLTMSALSVGPGGAPPSVVQTSEATLDLKEPYYRMAQSSYSWPQDLGATQQEDAPQQGGGQAGTAQHQAGLEQQQQQLGAERQAFPAASQLPQAQQPQQQPLGQHTGPWQPQDPQTRT